MIVKMAPVLPVLTPWPCGHVTAVLLSREWSCVLSHWWWRGRVTSSGRQNSWEGMSGQFNPMLHGFPCNLAEPLCKVAPAYPVVRWDSRQRRGRPAQVPEEASQPQETAAWPQTHSQAKRKSDKQSADQNISQVQFHFPTQRIIS